MRFHNFYLLKNFLREAIHDKGLKFLAVTYNRSFWKYESPNNWVLQASLENIWKLINPYHVTDLFLYTLKTFPGV